MWYLGKTIVDSARVTSRSTLEDSASWKAMETDESQNARPRTFLSLSRVPREVSSCCRGRSDCLSGRQQGAKFRWFQCRNWRDRLTPVAGNWHRPAHRVPDESEIPRRGPP